MGRAISMPNMTLKKEWKHMNHNYVSALHQLTQIQRPAPRLRYLTAVRQQMSSARMGYNQAVRKGPDR